MDTNDIINKLETFRKLPSYQLERRLDVLILPYLEKAFNDYLDTDDVIFICPEFPIWPKNKEENTLNKQSNLSKYCDYLLWSNKHNTVFMVELKTDCASIDEDQFISYYLNCKEGWHSLIRDYYNKTLNAAKEGHDWRKYCFGIQLLYNKVHILTGIKNNFNVMEFIEKKRGQGVTQFLEKKFSELSFEIKPNLSFIYLSPETCNEKLQKIQKISKLTEPLYYGNYYLQEFAEHTPEPLRQFLKKIEKRIWEQI